MEEQTEWMDERPPQDPQPLPDPTLQELWERIVSAYRPMTQAILKIGAHIENTFRGQEFYGAWTDEVEPSESDKQKMERLLKEKTRRNHGPRSGDPYMLNGKRKW